MYLPDTNAISELCRLIAATAQQHQLIVVTRNVADFAGFDVEVFNPFGQGPA